MKKRKSNSDRIRNNIHPVPPQPEVPGPGRPDRQHDPHKEPEKDNPAKVREPDRMIQPPTDPPLNDLIGRDRRPDPKSD